MHRGHRYPRLRAFVLGSLAVHGLLLAAWATSIPFGAEPRVALSVRLEGDHSTNPPSRAVRPERQQADRLHAARLPAPVIAPAESENEPARSTTAPGAGESGDADEIRARVLSRLRFDLARHFDYPWLARLRGWEGDVLLGVIVQASGRLDGIHVVRSSGFAVLDRSAIDSLRRIERIPEAVAWLHGRDLEMHLPVAYRLEGK